MFDGVERGGFLEQPARKITAPAVGIVMDDDLDEGAGQLIGLVRLGLVAGADLDHQIADADALAGAEAHVARQAVALVEHAEHGDAFGHRGRAGEAARLGADRALQRRAAAQIVGGDGRGPAGRRVPLNSDRRRSAEYGEAGEHCVEARSVHAARRGKDRASTGSAQTGWDRASPPQPIGLSWSKPCPSSRRKVTPDSTPRNRRSRRRAGRPLRSHRRDDRPGACR